MKVLNISRLGNRIKSLFVIGTNAEGSLILCGSGEKLSGFQLSHRIEFYEFDPITEDLKEDIFNDLNLLHSFFELYKNKVYTINGIGYFIEPEDTQRINIIKCDFNHYTYERLFSICIHESNNDLNNEFTMGNIQLTLLSDRYLAIKLYNKKTCQFDIYDVEERTKYDLIFAENDDMRYADIHCIDIDGRPYILFVKNGKSNWKMEFYIHKWKWTEGFIKYKDEKIFLFPLDELISKGKVYLDDTYKIVQVGETHDMHYHGYFNHCIVYSCKDLRHYEKDGACEDVIYEDNIFFYDIRKKITTNISYDRHILISNKDVIYGYENINGQLVIKNLISNQLYAIPNCNGWFLKIIDDLLIMRFNCGIVIYDLKKGIEIEKHYTENQYPHAMQPEFRTILAVQQEFKYLANEDLLVLY